MSALEVGKKLVAFCNAGQNIESIKTLYADDVESVEAFAPPGASPVTRGKDAVLATNTKWLAAHEIHGAKTEGPYPHGTDRFAVRFDFDVTNKESGKRMRLDEVALYTLKDGKIVKEEFFYDIG